MKDYQAHRLLGFWNGIEVIRSEITRSLVAVVVWLYICTDQWGPLY